MIRAEGLYKRYGEQQVFDGLSFNIDRGSVTTIMGRSGSGKSVLMRHLIGLDRPDSGDILIDGENIVGMSSKDLNRVRRRFGVLFQDGALFDSLSVQDNVAFPLREHTKLSESELLKKVDDNLARVGMKEHQHKFPSELSGGMRKKAALARALALDPEIVFFDEPTTGLDPITRTAIYRLIQETHAKNALTYILVSHDVKGILDISDRILMLFDGRIGVEGSPEEIRGSSDPWVRQFVTGSLNGPISID